MWWGGVGWGGGGGAILAKVWNLYQPVRAVKSAGMVIEITRTLGGSAFVLI